MHFFFNILFFFFLFFFLSSKTCQIWVGHNFVQHEIWNLIYGWTRYKTEHTELKKSVVQSVLLCLSCLFMYILTSKFIKNWKKKIKQAKKIKSLNFCWIKRAPKNKCARQLWDIQLIFFSLTVGQYGFHTCSCLIIQMPHFWSWNIFSNF